MRDVFTVAGLSLLKTRKEKAFIAIMTAVALFFSAIFTFAFGGVQAERTIPVALCDHDGSVLSSAMADSLKDAGVYEVLSLPEQDLYTAVRQGEVDVGFVIPQGFEASLSDDEALRVNVVSLAGSNSSMVIGKVLERKVTEYLLAGAVKDVSLDLMAVMPPQDPVDLDALARQVSEDFSRRPALAVEAASIATDREGSSKDIIGTAMLGVYLMFTMFTVVFTAGEILQERRDGTWMRLMATPASRASIMGGKVLGTYAIGAFQIGVLLLAGRYLLKMDYGSNPLGLALILAVFLLAVTGLGIMLSTMVKTLAQLQSLAPIVIVSTCMLGGCYWPLEVVSPAMQTIAKFTPQAWAITAMMDVSFRGASLASRTTNILVLLGFAVAFFVVGVSRVKYE